MGGRDGEYISGERTLIPIRGGVSISPRHSRAQRSVSFLFPYAKILILHAPLASPHPPNSGVAYKDHQIATLLCPSVHTMPLSLVGYQVDYTGLAASASGSILLPILETTNIGISIFFYRY